MTLRLEFEEAEIPLLSEALQSLAYNKVAGLIAKLQTQIDAQVKQASATSAVTPTAPPVTDVDASTTVEACTD